MCTVHACAVYLARAAHPLYRLRTSRPKSATTASGTGSEALAAVGEGCVCCCRARVTCVLLHRGMDSILLFQTDNNSESRLASEECFDKERLMLEPVNSGQFFVNYYIRTHIRSSFVIFYLFVYVTYV